MRRRAGIITVALLTAAVGVLGGCGSDDTGLPRPFDDAVNVMQEAGGYSFSATLSTVDNLNEPVVIDGTFQAPDRVEQGITRPGSPAIAMVLDGGSVFLKDPSSGKWVTQAAASTGAVDLRRSFAALSQAEGAKVEGSTAAFTLTGDAARAFVGDQVSGPVAVTATLGTVGLARITYQADLGGRSMRVTIDYSAVGAAPAVTLPV